MNSKFLNIIKVFLTITLIVSVSFLNFGLPVCLGMTQQDNCCCAPKNVPKCCRHNEAKKTERIQNHSGCEMKEAGKQVDLFTDLSVSTHKTFVKDFSYTQIITDDISSAYYLTSQITRPPPLLLSDEDIYISNRNLRI